MNVIKQQPTTAFRMGLEQEGLRLFESATTTYSIPHKNGNFVHGLTDSEREIVEKHYGLSFSNPEHVNAWKSVIFTLRHTLEVIDTKNPESILKQSVAKVIGEASDIDTNNKDSNFVITSDYLDEEAKLTSTVRADEAVSKLLEMKKTPKHLMAVAKYILPASSGIGKNPNNAYIKLREYLDGSLSSKKEAISTFETVCNMDKSVLYTTVDFKEALTCNVIRRDKDNYFYNTVSTCKYGKSEKESVEYLMDVKNQEELGTWADDDAPYSVRAQLKSKLL